MNVDDLRNVHDALSSLGHTVAIHSGPVDDMAEQTRQPCVQALGAVHPAEMQRLAMSVSDESSQAESVPTWSLQVDIKPTERSINLNMSPPDTAAADVYNRVARILDGGRRTWIEPNRAGRVVDWGRKLAVAAAFVLFVAAGPGWPLAVLAAVVAWLVWRTPVAGSAAGWFHRNAPATWFDEKSRAELNAERANRRANRRVAMISGPIGALIGATAGVLLTKWLG